MKLCVAPGCDRDRNRRTSGGRGLCQRCRLRAIKDETLHDYPRATRSRDELMSDWVVLRLRGMTRREAARELGMSFVAFVRAYERARAAGDPRARTSA